MGGELLSVIVLFELVLAALLAGIALFHRKARRDQPGASVINGVAWSFALLMALPFLVVLAPLALPWMPQILLAAGLGHFLVLAASFQVPARLGWKEELARLRPLNRKLMWTYGGFTVMTIVAFGVMTLLLRDEMLRGDKAAVALAAFIGVYWAARIGVDLFYFEHGDWPKGRQFVVGHALLLLLFAFLTATYAVVAVRGVLR